MIDSNDGTLLGTGIKLGLGEASMVEFSFTGARLWGEYMKVYLKKFGSVGATTFNRAVYSDTLANGGELIVELEPFNLSYLSSSFYIHSASLASFGYNIKKLFVDGQEYIFRISYNGDVAGAGLEVGLTDSISHDGSLYVDGVLDNDHDVKFELTGTESLKTYMPSRNYFVQTSV